MLKRVSDLKKKTVRRAAAVLMTLLMAAGLAAGAAASEADRMPDLDPEKSCSLTVTMTYTDPNVEDTAARLRPMMDVAVKLAKVADLAVNGGSAEYTLLPRYADSGITLAGMTASESKEAAALLAPLAAGADVQIQRTDESGNAVFSNLTPGMYLVFQDPEANTQYRVDAVMSMLYAVPFPAVQAGGVNEWQYEVSAVPKTELTGPHNNGVIRVTKQLWNYEDQLAYNPPIDQELVFYVGLFEDEACTVQVPGTTDLPIRIRNSDHGEAVFENLTTDRTYYIAETDGKGSVVPSVEQNTVLFSPEYPNGQAVSIPRQNPEGELLFRNVTNGLPVGFYYGGEIKITKKAVMGGEPYPMNRTFYAVIFADKECTKPLGSVIELPLEGGSEAEVTIPVTIGESKKDTAVFYIAETDQNGVPLRNGDDLGFVSELSVEDGKVVLSVTEDLSEVVITNTFEEVYETEIETEVETEIETETETEKKPQAGGRGPRTGDDTPILTWLLLMAAALCVLIGAGAAAKKRGRRMK